MLLLFLKIKQALTIYIIFTTYTLMAVPKKKTSPSRRDMRASHRALKRSNIVFNEKGESTLRHFTVVGGCFYKRITKKRAGENTKVEQ